MYVGNLLEFVTHGDYYKGQILVSSRVVGNTEWDGEKHGTDWVFGSISNLVVSGQKSTWNDQTTLLEDWPDQDMTHRLEGLRENV